MLRASEIRVDLGATTILHDVSLSVTPGEIVAIVGPNGAGKSTVIATLSGSLSPHTGVVELEQKRLATWPAQALAHKRAVLAQHSALTFSFRVLEVVLLGRAPYAGRTTRSQDFAAVSRALIATDAEHLIERDYTTLSGGEQQRVHLARVMAQIDFPHSDPNVGPRYILLDEPTSSLDLAHQHTILTLARRAAEAGIGVLSVLHDLNLAAMYADSIVMLKLGRVAASGTPADVVRADLINEVFGLSVRIAPHPTRGCPQVFVS